MAEDMEQFSIERVTGEGRTGLEDAVARELPVTIQLNEKELVTMLCSPSDLDSLAVGFLFSEGLIKSRDEIRRVLVDDRRGLVRVRTTNNVEVDSELLFKRVITSGCGRGVTFYNAADAKGLEKVESNFTITAREAMDLVHEFQHRSPVYLKTGGIHSAALCNNREILVFAEDIGRHNAIDKILGRCIMEGITTEDRMIVSSGRISSEMLLKVAKKKVPMISSISAPTDVAVKLADELGITLIGFVRGKRMNVYTSTWRVK